MQYTDFEIHAAIKRLLAAGYAALTVRERRIVDWMSAFC